MNIQSNVINLESQGEESFVSESFHGGVPLEELETSFNTDSNNIELTTLQNEYLKKVELEKKAKKLTIPTDDGIVKSWLRMIGEPITLFGEGAYERRERLGILLASGKDSLYKSLLDSLLVSREKGVKPDSVVVEDNEEFFVPGSEELLQWRKKILLYSLNRAKMRLSKERGLKSVPTLLAQSNRKANFERIQNFKLLASQVGGSRPLSSCSISPDSSLIAIGDFGGVCRIWSMNDYTLVRELEGFHHSRIGNVTFNPKPGMKCNLASCDSDGKIALWTLDGQSSSTSPSPSSPVGELLGHTGRVSKISFHPSGELLGSASFDYSWRLWNVENCKEIQLQEGHSRPVYSIAFHQDGSLVATGGLDSYGRIWDLRLGKAIWTLQGHIKSILSIAFNPNFPTLATAGEDGTIRIWDLRKIQPTYTLPAHSSVITSVKWDEEGLLLLSAGFDGVAKIWSSSDWRQLVTLSGHDSKIFDADLTPSSSLVTTVGADRTFKLWSLV